MTDIDLAALDREIGKGRARPTCSKNATGPRATGSRRREIEAVRLVTGGEHA
jgi:hypothetical protein